MADQALQRSVLRYLTQSKNGRTEFQTLRAIIKNMSLPEDWWEASLGGLDEIDLERAVLSILEDLAYEGVLEKQGSSRGHEPGFRLCGDGMQHGEDAGGDTAIGPSKGLGDTRDREGARALDKDHEWLLRMLASQRRHEVDGVITVPDVFERFRIPFASRWVNDALRRLEMSGFVKILPELAEQFRQPMVTITHGGVRMADEFNRRDGVEDAFDLLITTQKAIHPSIEAVMPADAVEAADTLIRLDHGDHDYLAIKSGLRSLYEQVRQDNQVGSTAAERDRILSSLSAARELWASTELQLIQIKVGVIMAVEEASRALVVVGKAVGKSILVDLIKAYINNKTGLHL